MLLWDCSELEFQGELDRAWSADLIERIQTAIRATGAQAARQHLGGVSEKRIGQTVDGRAEAWMVEDCHPPFKRGPTSKHIIRLIVAHSWGPVFLR
jgi:hypothetical protein